ncbi:hypothetical protein ACSTS3_18120 [Aquimarina muelleri]|uniref:hypothetical protein n=1 Tax=Aquimarina muelleri TaxID=279356 RepID=UPI003F6833D3
MIRSVLYIVTLLFLSSCSRSIYYAFEKEGTYCTLEEKKNGTVIYRAVSKEKYNIHSSGLIEYLYIESIDSSNDFFAGISGSFFLKLINSIEVKSEEICFSNIELSIDEFIVHYSKINKDSLDFLSDNLDVRLQKNNCFAKHKITWFPPYLKKIKKIDYKKFNLPLKKKYLKTMADKDK